MHISLQVFKHVPMWNPTHEAESLQALTFQGSQQTV